MSEEQIKWPRATPKPLPHSEEPTYTGVDWVPPELRAPSAMHVVYHYDEVKPVVSVQIETGVSASGKRTWSTNVHARTVAEAMAMIDEAEMESARRFG